MRVHVPRRASNALGGELHELGHNSSRHLCVPACGESLLVTQTHRLRFRCLIVS